MLFALRALVQGKLTPERPAVVIASRDTSPFSLAQRVVFLRGGRIVEGAATSLDEADAHG